MFGSTRKRTLEIHSWVCLIMFKNPLRSPNSMS